MDRDELMKRAKVVAMNWSHTTDPRSPSELLADFAFEMYEAGQRAERVRIVFELDELLGDVGDGKLARFMDELRADPAESGE